MAAVRSGRGCSLPDANRKATGCSAVRKVLKIAVRLLRIRNARRVPSARPRREPTVACVETVLAALRRASRSDCWRLCSKSCQGSGSGMDGGKVSVLMLHVLFCEACQLRTHGLSGHCEGFGTHGGGVGGVGDFWYCLLMFSREKAQSKIKLKVGLYLQCQEEFQVVWKKV